MLQCGRFNYSTSFLTDLKMVQDVLQMSNLEWTHILETATASGELLYLWGKKSNQEPAIQAGNQVSQSALVFQSYCETLPQSVYAKFVIRCRPFKKTSPDFSSSEETFTPKLFCLDLKKCWGHRRRWRLSYQFQFLKFWVSYYWNYLTVITWKILFVEIFVQTWAFTAIKNLIACTHDSSFK